MTNSIEPFLISEIKDNCGVTRNFTSLHEEESYNKNLKKLKDYKDGFYIDNDIIYKSNKFGHRSKYDYPPNEDYILVAGCSHSYGQGLHEEHRYSNLLEDHYGIPVLNIGTQGVGVNFIKDNLIQLLSSKYPLPKFMITQLPNFYRVTVDNFHFRASMVRGQIWFRPVDEGDLDAMMRYSITSHRHLNYLLDDNNIPSFEFVWGNYHYIPPGVYNDWDGTGDSFIDFGRDLDHPGIESNKKIFETIVEKGIIK